MAILDLASEAWNHALGIPRGQQPVALVLEGSWWRDRATRNRLAQLSQVQETAFPDIFIGKHAGVSIAYCCAYGAARAAEPTHVFTQMGTPLVIQIGTCGAMDAGLEPGTVMVPDQVTGRDGVSAHYYGAETIALDARLCSRARVVLSRKGVDVAGGAHLTWPSLFAQTDVLCASWAAEGLRTVDMETAAVSAVANHFGAQAIAMLTVWDALSAGRSFLDQLAPAQCKALEHSDAVIFEVALQLALEVDQLRAA